MWTDLENLLGGGVGEAVEGREVVHVGEGEAVAGQVLGDGQPGLVDVQDFGSRLFFLHPS